MVLPLLLALSVVAAIVALYLYMPKTAVPGVPGDYPWFQGFVMLYNRLFKVGALDFLASNNRRFGNIWSLRIPLFMDAVTTLNAPDVEHVLHTNFENYVRIAEDTNPSWRFKLFFGKGIFAANGPSWWQQRNAARGLFTIQSISDYVPVFADKAVVLANLLEESARQRRPVDMQDFFLRYTLDSFGVIGFGFSFDSLVSVPRFPGVFDYLQRRVEETFRDPFAIRSKDDLFLQGMAQVDEELYGMIRQRKSENFKEKSDLLSRFMCLVDDNGQPYSDVWLRDILFNFLIAGRDTTALTLTWFMYCMSQNPACEALVREEIARELPDPKEPITLKSLKGLKYLDWCLNETLRLYPAVPSEGRVSVKEDLLPSGHRIPPGCFVGVSSYLMHRRADYFPDPESFKPERWADPLPHPYCYIPFYAGPQTCLGQSLALAEAKTAIVVLMRRLKLNLTSGQKVVPEKFIVLRARNGVLMNVVPNQE